MKNLLLITFLLFCVSTFQAQEKKDYEVGEILKIEKPSTREFNHIHFPRANFIIKKGGIVNYNRIYGEEVEIVAIETKDDGTKQARLKRTDGRKFFQRYSTVLADIDKALEAGEISI